MMCHVKVLALAMALSEDNQFVLCAIGWLLLKELFSSLGVSSEHNAETLVSQTSN